MQHISKATNSTFLQRLLIASSCLGLVWGPFLLKTPTALAQVNQPEPKENVKQRTQQREKQSTKQQSAALTSGEVYYLQNIVELLLRNQPPRQARTQDTIVPRDALRTGTQSLAELLFNEGSIARVGSNSAFQFTPGLRRYQLPDGNFRADTVFQLQQGVAAIVVPPTTNGDGSDLIATVIETPDGQVISTTTAAMIVVVDPTTGGTTVIALTNDIFVSGVTPDEFVTLQGGQQITVSDGQLGPVQDFNLRRLYDTSALAEGLGPGQEDALQADPARVQDTFTEVRKATLGAIAQQDDWLGLCTLDGRGGDSTLSANCVTTGADDPLTEFEDQREDSFPPDRPDDISPTPPIDETPPGGAPENPTGDPNNPTGNPNNPTGGTNNPTGGQNIP